jgi:hypothetical protein
METDPMDTSVPPPPPVPSSDVSISGSGPTYGAAPAYSAPAYGGAPYSSAPYGVAPYGSAPAYGSYRPNNLLAGVSLGLALGAIVVGTLLSVAAVICGHIALRQIRMTGQQGHTAAVWALVLGYMGIAFSVALLLFIVAVFAIGAGDFSGVPDSI